MNFFVIKRKNLLIFFCIVILIGICFGVGFKVVFATTRPVDARVIVIDAGHGGVDGGSEGINGSQESELNLQYALTLKKYCEDFGYKVILTRKDGNGLYSQFASNKKKDDMQKRKEIIEKANPDIVVSIHMNSFPQSYVKGAQVFYNQESDSSKVLANSIQKQFNKNLDSNKNTQAGDYYIVNCSNYIGVICECGFISNPEEERLLLTEDYRNQVCYSILCGILAYFMA